ncbi:hypothetical protein C0995_011616 [Termitomyces sp. Mi166|nr:hypothetical protein C0995_011616 [Termitomyces sp. Mi166\
MPFFSCLPYRTFPTELLHRIIVQVIADSVHTICVSPENVDWEMNVFPTFCKVSYNFRALTLEIMKQAFRSQPTSEDISRHVTFDRCRRLFPPIAKQFERLRLFGNRLYRPTRSRSHFDPEADDALLIFGYSLFLSALDLRYNSIRAPSRDFQIAQEISISALSLSLAICPKVRPVGLADVLSDAMQNQMDLVQSGLDAVRTAETLDSLMKEWTEMEQYKSKDENVEVRKSENLAKIRDQIEELEKVYEAYAFIIESDSIFQTSELPNVLPVVKKLQEMEVDGQRLFAASVERLFERWTATPCFPTELDS